MEPTNGDRGQFTYRVQTAARYHGITADQDEIFQNVIPAVTRFVLPTHLKILTGDHIGTMSELGHYNHKNLFRFKPTCVVDKFKVAHYSILCKALSLSFFSLELQDLCSDGTLGQPSNSHTVLLSVDRRALYRVFGPAVVAYKQGSYYKRTAIDTSDIDILFTASGHVVTAAERRKLRDSLLEESLFRVSCGSTLLTNTTRALR